MPLPPVNPAPRTEDWLVQELTTAHVLEPVQVRACVQEFRAAGGAADAAGLAGFLVAAGILTPFQAARALAGEAHTLALGPYLITEAVGAGSLGTVYRAVGRSDRKRYAVKVLPLRSLWNVHLAKKQVALFADLPPHPAVVPFVGVGTSGGSHYLAWPFAEGTSLEQAVARSGRLPAADAVRVATQVTDGLAACHARGIVHGLLKPSNVLLGADGPARLLDLGVGAILSENIAEDESMLDTISTAGAAMGMLDCCAPETVADPALRSPAGDLYSLGCVLYFALAGRLPFPDGSAVEKMIAHQTREPPPVAAFAPDAPGWLADLVRELLRKDPAARPKSAAAVVSVLKAGKVPAAGELVRLTLAPDPATAPRPTPPRPGRPPSQVDFDLPAEPLPARTAPSRVPLAPPVRKPQGMIPTPPMGPLDTPPEFPAVPVPPPPGFAGSVWFRLRRAVRFWRPPLDVVQLTVFGPPRVAPGAAVKLQVFAHPAGALGGVCALARTFHPDGEPLASGYVQAPVPRGAEIGLHLSVANAGVGRGLAALRWAGRPQPHTFDLSVPWASPPGAAAGVLSAGVDGVLAGRVEFALRVTPPTRPG